MLGMVFITFVLTLILGATAITNGAVTLNNDHPVITITARNASWEQTNKNSRESERYLPAPSGTFFILVEGNDQRPGVEGARADALHLLGINTSQNKVTMLDFPRDTTVAIPGHGTNKINAANAFGGSSLTAQTLEQLTGVKISYILEANFAAFINVVNDLGGIDIDVKVPMHDVDSGAHFDPGVKHMDGTDTLYFSRDRHGFPTGDLQRTQNQGEVLISGLKELRSKKKSIVSQFESAAIIAKDITLTNLSLKDLFFLMQIASGIDPANVSNVLVPWSASNTLAPKAQDLFKDFKDNAILDSYKP